MILLSIVISFFVSLAFCSGFIVFWRRRVRRGLETETIIKKLRTEIGEMITALNGTTERNIALLENKIRIINEQIDKAAKAAGVLKREHEKQEAVSQVYSSLARSKPLTLAVEDDNLPAPSIDFETLSIREKALLLHRKGDSPDTIATRLDMSRGEIELIISLHEGRPQN
ncbi:MAG: hypothetical protein DRP60_12635 [Spirochaetes bacterium]|nr:MAG: hypothetical protein DRP60_12635 [Spirochaetota bacterium]